MSGDTGTAIPAKSISNAMIPTSDESSTGLLPTDSDASQCARIRRRGLIRIPKNIVLLHLPPFRGPKSGDQRISKSPWDDRDGVSRRDSTVYKVSSTARILPLRRGVLKRLQHTVRNVRSPYRGIVDFFFDAVDLVLAGFRTV